MAERYIRLYKSEQEYFLSGCPISLAAFAVLRDKKEEINLLQLKFKNCSDKSVNGIILSVTTLDQLGQKIETVTDHQYARLNAEKGSFFGSNSTINLREKTPVSDIVITLHLVMLSDGSKWKNEEGLVLEACLPPRDLLVAFPKELIEEYQRVTNQHMKYIPEDLKGSWRCSCGSLNIGERCVVCETLKKDVFEKCTVEFLVGSYSERVYSKACRLKTSTSIDSLSKAVELFNTIPQYKDASQMIEECNEAIKAREEYERGEKERQEKAKEEQQIAKKKKTQKYVKYAALIIISLLALIFIIRTVDNSTKFERYQKVLVSNSSAEEKRVALAYIANRVINERIDFENSFDGKKDEAYYKKIVSIEEPLRDAIESCDLSTFIEEKGVERAFKSYSKAIGNLSASIGTNNGAILDSIGSKYPLLVTLYREGYIRLPSDEYKKCCEIYIKQKLTKGMTGEVTYSKDSGASTWSVSTDIKNDTLAELSNCKLQTKFESGFYKDNCEVVIDNWSPDTTEKIVYHVSNGIGSSKNGVSVEFIVSIESIEMVDNDYIGDK